MLVSSLIRLVSLSDDASQGDFEPLSRTAQSSLASALRIMSASDFLGAVLSMLQATDPKVRTSTQYQARLTN